jgi:DNA-binding transcriptional LysR family regulator
MHTLNLDMDVLRTLVLATDLGGLAKAGEKLGRTQSAISLQMKKLEDQLQCRLFRRSGRSVVLTEKGEMLVSYGRRILALNDEAVWAVGGEPQMDIIRLGLPQDLADNWLPTVLAEFNRRHPRVHFEVRTGWWQELRDFVQQGDIDLALVYGDAADLGSGKVLAHLPLIWVGAEDFVVDPAASLPLVLPDAPCTMRQKCIDALNRADAPWRIAFSSYSLGGVMGAVSAGLGVSVRTPLGTPAGLFDMSDSFRLPPLASVPLTLYLSTMNLSAIITDFLDIVKQSLATPLKRRSPARQPAYQLENS